jgi:ADP-sugar diphosphatase
MELIFKVSTCLEIGTLYIMEPCCAQGPSSHQVSRIILCISPSSPWFHHNDSVGFIKLKSHFTLAQVSKSHDDDDKNSDEHSNPLPGICLLRGDSVAVLVALICQDDNRVYSLMVEQPRIPIGQVSCLELPAGMMDDDAAAGGCDHDKSKRITGAAIQELQEECGIQINDSDNNLMDLTQLANMNNGIALSQGGCDEHIRIMYLEQYVTTDQLETMKGRLTGLRDHGEVITLRLVPMEELWRSTCDAKTML